MKTFNQQSKSKRFSAALRGFLPATLVAFTVVGATQAGAADVTFEPQVGNGPYADGDLSRKLNGTDPYTPSTTNVRVGDDSGPQGTNERLYRGFIGFDTSDLSGLQGASIGTVTLRLYTPSGAQGSAINAVNVDLVNFGEDLDIYDYGPSSECSGCDLIVIKANVGTLSGFPAGTYSDVDITDPDVITVVQNGRAQFRLRADPEASLIGQNQIIFSDADTSSTPSQLVITSTSSPIHACQGFEPPMAAGPVTVRGNRALPLKALLHDANGYLVTDLDLTALPVLQVLYTSSSGGDPIDVTDQALPAGQGTEGNEFVFTEDLKWQFNLKTQNFTAKGTYTVLMKSGDEMTYDIDPMCEGTFIINK